MSVLTGQGWRSAPPERVAQVAADPPGWLLSAQANRRRKLYRRRRLVERRQVAQRLSIQARAVVEYDISGGQVEDAWYQELKRAETEAQGPQADARAERDLDAARREARRLVEQLSPERVRDRIAREHAAAHDAARYRATQLLHQAGYHIVEPTDHDHHDHGDHSGGEVDGDR